MPGTVFAYGPGTAHDFCCLPEKPMTKYFVALSGRQVVRHLVRPGPRPGEIVQSSAPEQISEIFEMLISAGQRDTPLRERVCQTAANFLLLRLAETAVPLGTVGTATFETYQRCLEWIDRNYQHLEGLRQIARGCHVHEAYLSRLFQRYSHRSPWQYVLWLKMRDAVQHLQDTHARVRDVARRCGFTDPYIFSRTFRRVMGMSPRDFRRLQGRR
jgi:AraC-like DNA-binding protein